MKWVNINIFTVKSNNALNIYYVVYSIRKYMFHTNSTKEETTGKQLYTVRE